MADGDNLRDKSIDLLIQRMAQCVDRISELNARMTIIIEQQAQQTTRLDRLETRLEAQLSNMSIRISELEKWLWRLTGFGSAMLMAFEFLKYLK